MLKCIHVALQIKTGKKKLKLPFCIFAELLGAWRIKKRKSVHRLCCITNHCKTRRAHGLQKPHKISLHGRIKWAQIGRRGSEEDWCQPPLAKKWAACSKLLFAYDVIIYILWKRHLVSSFSREESMSHSKGHKACSWTLSCLNWTPKKSAFMMVTF